MSENVRVIQSLAQKAAVDTTLLRGLANDPVRTVKNLYPMFTDEEANDVGNKAFESIFTIPAQEIIDLFKQMIHYATNAFKTTVFLNQVLFWAGMILLGVTFGFEITGRIMGKDTWQNVATTGIIGAIGIGTVISSFIFRPLSSIQNSLGNLAQIEVGVLNFIDRRSVISASGHPQNINDAKQISDELQKAASETMELIQKYCEEPAGTSTKDSNKGRSGKTPKPASPQP